MIDSSFGQSLQADLVGLDDVDDCALAALLGPLGGYETDSDDSSISSSEGSESDLEDGSEGSFDALEDIEEAWCSCADVDVTVNPTCDCCIRDTYTHGNLATCSNSVASKFDSRVRLETCASHNKALPLTGCLFASGWKLTFFPVVLCRWHCSNMCAASMLLHM
jgi:hypothetical protein